MCASVCTHVFVLFLLTYTHVFYARSLLVRVSVRAVAVETYEMHFSHSLKPAWHSTPIHPHFQTHTRALTNCVRLMRSPTPQQGKVLCATRTNRRCIKLHFNVGKTISVSLQQQKKQEQHQQLSQSRAATWVATNVQQKTTIVTSTTCAYVYTHMCVCVGLFCANFSLYLIFV